MNRFPEGLERVLKMTENCPPIRVIRDPERPTQLRPIWPVVFRPLSPPQR
jgi:hypothetical protein